MINEEDAAKHAGLQPEQRFYLTERLARDRLTEARREAGQNDYPAYDEHDYMIEVMAAAEAFGIAELGGWQLPSQSNEHWQDECRNFRAAATKVSQKLMFQYAGMPQSDPNTVALDGPTKERLRFHLGQVRGIIDNDPMPDWKKEELYEAISALEREIDKARTPLAAVLDVVSKAFEGSETIMDAVRKVVRIVQEAKASEREKAKLAAPVEPKRIEAPKPRQLTPPQPKGKNGFRKNLMTRSRSRHRDWRGRPA